MRTFAPRTFSIGGHSLLLTRRAMRHFLNRHHPRYWDGTLAATQTFFRESLTPDDLANIVERVLQQNWDDVAEMAPNATQQFEGVVDGVRYVVGVTEGRIGQLYPVYPLRP